MSDTDFIVVGQGLAGSVLSLKLIEQGFSVKVIDKPELSSCSKIAAGIWNPVVFKRLTKSWMVDDLLPEMLKFYRGAETKLNSKFITERNILKIFSEQQEADLWQVKSSFELKNYLLNEVLSENNFKHVKKTAYGHSKVLQAGNLDVSVFLNATKDFLAANDSLINEVFDHSALKAGEIITYKNVSAKRIVFADGYLVKNNPYFNYLPFKPAKGEVLTVEMNDLNTGNNIINKNAFLLPLAKGLYKAGATYNWEDLSENTTGDALKELLSKLEKIADCEIKVLAQEAGIRPSVLDRRPVIGPHPKHNNMYLFNGFGTKGVMLAPYFAGHLINHVKDGKAISKDVCLSRFNHFFVN